MCKQGGQQVHRSELESLGQSLPKKEDLAGIYLINKRKVQEREQTLSKKNAHTDYEIACFNSFSQQKIKKKQRWPRVKMMHIFCL
jgi:hypothetical protein